MANRPFWYASDDTRSTVTGAGSTTYGTKLTLNIPSPPANTTIVVFWSAVLDGSTTGADPKLRINDGTTTYDEVIQRTGQSSSQRVQVSGVATITTGASPSDIALNMQYCNHANTSHTAGIRDCHMAAFPLISGVDFSASTVGEASVSSTQWNNDRVTLNFTPPTTGDYLIIGKLCLKSATASTDATCRLYDGTTAYMTINPSAQLGTTSYVPWMSIVKATGLSGSQTWKVQPARITNNISVRYGYIIALRIDELLDFQTSLVSGSTTTTSTTLQQRTSVTYTPAVRPYIEIAHAHIAHSGATTLFKNAMMIDDAAVGSTALRAIVTANSEYAFTQMRVGMGSGVSRKLGVSYAANSADTVTIKEAAVFAWRVNSLSRPIMSSRIIV
jgi:hypothetical protein